jgi:hypothetical protein
MNSPQNNPPSQKSPVHERLLDKLIDSPFATLWNLTVIIGGLIALIYFTQLGYLPDMDLKSSAAFFLGISVVSLFLLGLLILVFSVPSWMLRNELRSAADESEPRWHSPVRVALTGFLAALACLLMIGLFALDPGHEQLARRIIWTSGLGIAFCATTLVVFLGKKFARTLRLLFAWLMVTPSFWLMALMRVQAHDGAGITLLIVGAFVAVIIIVNSVLTALRFDTQKAWLAVVMLSLALPIIYLTLPTKQPSIPESVFKKLSLGGMVNTTLIVKTPACNGVNALIEQACIPIAGKDVGCITPALMANRLGEYLLIFESGQNKIKVPLQKNDVLVWSASTEKSKCHILPAGS